MNCSVLTGCLKCCIRCTANKWSVQKCVLVSKYSLSKNHTHAMVLKLGWCLNYNNPNHYFYLFAEINGVVPSQEAAMSATDNEVDQATKQVSEMTLGDKYNPDKVPYEVATFALS